MPHALIAIMLWPHDAYNGGSLWFIPERADSVLHRGLRIKDTEDWRDDMGAHHPQFRRNNSVVYILFRYRYSIGMNSIGSYVKKSSCRIPCEFRNKINSHCGHSRVYRWQVICDFPSHVVKGRFVGEASSWPLAMSIAIWNAILNGAWL